MKICISINSGFQTRYLLQTGLVSNLSKNGCEIIIIASKEEFDVVKEMTEGLYKIYQAPKKTKKNVIEKYLEYTRFFYRAKYNSTSEIIYNRMYQQTTNSFNATGIFILHKISKILSSSILLRKLLVKTEKIFSRFDSYESLLERISPDLLFLTSHGSFGNDKYLAYAAQSKSIKLITAILSWDNITSQTFPAYHADHLLVWTEKMKQDVIELIDYEPDKVVVVGSAYFDIHFSSSTKEKKNVFFKRYNLDMGKKLIFFATKSPNSYPWSPNIIVSIANELGKNKKLDNCQLLVRPHPIHFKKDHKKNYVYQNILDQYKILAEKYPNIKFSYPSIFSKSKSFLMKNEESKLLSNILMHSDVVINLFSTVNIESAIYDKPTINVCYEYDDQMYKFDRDNPRYDIISDAKETHNQRIVDSGGISIVFNENQLIDQISRYLSNPEIDSYGRKIIRDREVGPYRGEAAKKIAEVTLGYLK